MKFNEFGLNDELLEAIGYMGFEEATPVQENTIPEILTGQDMIACAQTGTGKTAAFLLPVLHKLSKEDPRHTDTLIIVPTRELAIQIDEQIRGLAYFSNISSMAIYGGGDGPGWDQEKKALLDGTNIIIATPGKLLSHLKLGYVDFGNIRHLILDEADRMLDIGFHDDILRIISYLPKNRQTLMFSATMPGKIRELASKILNNPFEYSAAISKPAEGVLQAVYLAHDEQKIPLIHSLIADKSDYSSILIFCSTKKKVNDLYKDFSRKKYNVKSISSDLEQDEREAVLQSFKSRKTRILVATDVLSRGIDIKDINLVINYDVPGDAEDYVHRVGRTARAETTGVAITLVNSDDMYKMKKIEELIEARVLKMPIPPELGEGPTWNPEYIKPRKHYHKKKRHVKHKQRKNKKPQR
jgi:superfamily II DNA/RNA helicase